MLTAETKHGMEREKVSERKEKERRRTWRMILSCERCGGRGCCRVWRKVSHTLRGWNTYPSLPTISALFFLK
jgi:hypothetical protein